jgi:nitrogen fixation protein NifQ
MLAPLFPRPRPAHDALVEHILSFSKEGHANAPILASVMAGWALGHGVLPFHLGLGFTRFSELLFAVFPGLRWEPPADKPLSAGPVIQPEFDDLLAFLQAFADPDVEGSDAMATVVATACMGADHLWQDLGLPSRAALSELMSLDFPALAHANRKDMKWKKFLYRELCQREGIYVCASPSCEACKDHPVCFGPEV